MYLRYFSGIYDANIVLSYQVVLILYFLLSPSRKVGGIDMIANNSTVQGLGYLFTVNQLLHSDKAETQNIQFHTSTIYVGVPPKLLAQLPPLFPGKSCRQGKLVKNHYWGPL